MLVYEYKRMNFRGAGTTSAAGAAAFPPTLAMRGHTGAEGAFWACTKVLLKE